jgi:hypothetical protein
MFGFLKRLLASRGGNIKNNNVSLGDDDYIMRGPTIDWSDEQDPIRRYILSPTGTTPPKPRSATEKEYRGQ